MPAGTAAPLESVNAFPVEDSILFKHYFDGEAVFDRLRPYYDGTQYRFEVPRPRFDSIRRFLRGHGYDVAIVDRPEAYYVVVRKYSAHPENIFKVSVSQESVDGYNCFLMTDKSAVESAVAAGARRLTRTPLSLSTRTLGDFASP